MSQPIEHTVQNAQTTVTRIIKNRLYDIISVIIILTVLALSLGVIERRIITLGELLDVLVECIPMFFAGMLLNTNLYNKGIFYGKQTDTFIKASRAYSKLVTDLTGEQIQYIPEFCEKYNNDALKSMQSTVLKSEGLSYEQFTSPWKDGNTDRKPLRAMCENELAAVLNEEQIAVVKKAKKLKVKGILVNTLLGTNTSDDITDVGPTESDLKNKKIFWSTIVYFVSTIVLALIGVKNVQDWGWFGIALVLFKVMFIFCRSYMSYFDGYNDVTIHLVNSTNRKTDVLKECIYWINDKTGNNNYHYNGNNLDKIDIE